MKKRKSAYLYAAANVSLGILYVIAGLKRKTSGKLYALVGAPLLILFLLLGGCLNQKPTKSKVAVKTDAVFVSTIVKKAVAAGSVVPRKQIAVKAQVSGIIEKVFVAAGQTVTAGQLLARVKLTPNAVELNSAENDLQKARLSFNDAKHEKERYEKLFNEKVVAEKEYNQYLLAYQKAAADQSAAQNNVQLVKVGVSPSGMAANEVRSTVNGVLLDVPAKEGNFVIERNTFNEGTTIATIADMNDMTFLGKVEEADVNGLKPGMELDITVRATEEKTYKARLEFISPNGVKEEGATNFEIRAAILMDRTDFLRAGYSANADIILEKRDNVLCLKESLVRFDESKPYVEVETRPQVFERRYVQLGLSDEINIQVLGGLRPNERVKAEL